METILSQEANSSSIRLEIHTLYKTNVLKHQQPDSILRKITTATHTENIISLKHILILSSKLHLSVHCRLLSLFRPNKSLYQFLVFSIPATCPAYPILNYFSTLNNIR